MTMRGNATEYLAVILDDVLATAAMPGEDVPAGLGIPLDQADAAMAFVTIPETDTTGREAAYTALAELFVLLRVRRKIALRFNVGTGGDSYALSQSLTGVNQLIAEARQRAVFLAGEMAVVGGVGADTAASTPGIGSIDLDWSGGGALIEEHARW